MNYQVRLEGGVINLDTGTIVMPHSIEWAVYQAWLSAGGVLVGAVQPAPEPLSEAEVAARNEIATRAALTAQLRAMPVIQALRTRTPAEVDTWIQTNVTDLASAKTVLRILAYVVALIARERLS